MLYVVTIGSGPVSVVAGRLLSAVYRPSIHRRSGHNDDSDGGGPLAGHRSTSPAPDPPPPPPHPPPPPAQTDKVTHRHNCVSVPPRCGFACRVYMRGNFPNRIHRLRACGADSLSKAGRKPVALITANRTRLESQAVLPTSALVFFCFHSDQ